MLVLCCVGLNLLNTRSRSLTIFLIALKFYLETYIQ